MFARSYYQVTSYLRSGRRAIDGYCGRRPQSRTTQYQGDWQIDSICRSICDCITIMYARVASISVLLRAEEQAAAPVARSK